ncbi:hypothetical protein AAG570_013933 [Ranatra chinensis]|uniref:Uncharacterized protein n=1 Tax=Ranatra chinensis TaxID=642074 RepID=A0ABD0YDL2_9HEMI
MASKRRNRFYQNKKQETTEIATCNLPSFPCYNKLVYNTECYLTLHAKPVATLTMALPLSVGSDSVPLRQLKRPCYPTNWSDGDVAAMVVRSSCQAAYPWSALGCSDTTFRAGMRTREQQEVTSVCPNCPNFGGGTGRDTFDGRYSGFSTRIRNRFHGYELGREVITGSNFAYEGRQNVARKPCPRCGSSVEVYGKAPSSSTKERIQVHFHPSLEGAVPGKYQKAPGISTDVNRLPYSQTSAGFQSWTSDSHGGLRPTCTSCRRQSNRGYGW